jgi:hypothetical protein
VVVTSRKAAMTQPRRDEISQGMDRHRSPAARKLIGFGDAQWARLHRLGRRLRTPRALIATGSAAILVAGTATAVVVTRPPYPHAWCGPLLTGLHARGKSEAGYAAVLVRLRRRDDAPVGKLLSDLDDYTVASSVATNQSGVTPAGSIVGMASTFAAVKGDLQALNRACGQPRAAYERDSF